MRKKIPSLFDMNINEKVKRMRKHYKADPVRFENMLRKEIEASPNKGALWASLIFDADIKFLTFEERKAAKTAANHRVTCFTIKEGKIFP